MKPIKKLLRIVLFVFLGMVVLLGAWWFWPARTPQIKSGDNASVAAIEYIQLGGVDQCVLIRSKDIRHPVLLFLHGGPGMPMMYMAHDFQRPLEDDFTVVQWDRRGAGKTWARQKPAVESMTVRQILDDAYGLIDTLRNRYHQEKIYLVGHSFGSYLGSIMVSERPELFHAYVSVGQVVNPEKARLLQEEFVKNQAEILGREDILDTLERAQDVNLENWLFEFGGELKNSHSFFPMVWSGIWAPEYTLPEVLKVAEASAFSSSHMQYNVLQDNIEEAIRIYEVPVYFFVGLSDYTTPHELITGYYQWVEAPEKEIIYFNNSAHFPFFEEPDRFCSELKRLLIPKD